MGEAKKDALRVDFDGQIRLEFHGANVTSDAGLLAYRELDDALGLERSVIFKSENEDGSSAPAIYRLLPR